MGIALFVISNLLVAGLCILLTQRYYLSWLDEQKITLTERLSVTDTPEPSLVDELLQQTIHFVENYPEKWSPWGLYTSNGKFTAFEFANSKKGIKIALDGRLLYRHLHGDLKDDKDVSRFIEGPVPLTAEQKDIIKNLFVQLQARHLLQIFEKFSSEQQAKDLIEKPKTVV